MSCASVIGAASIRIFLGMLPFEKSFFRSDKALFPLLLYLAEK